ncbi:MAG TPA: CoA-binding protein [Castellaniella sp.]|uniref:succinate--CoA ligase subunit alpha n=1 Tax=Castellaniella sp. TaxID=1955812 RepID=UPI002F0CD9E9
MILEKHHRVLVQGITGKQGRFWTECMQNYGTQVVGGVNPKRAGEQCCGVPVFATAKDAVSELGQIDYSVMFVPPSGALTAGLDAIESGIGHMVVLTEHIPVHDVMRIHAAARRHGTHIIGPNTAGIVTPGVAFAGIMPAFNPRVFQPGDVGVVSRSGSLGTLVCLDIVNAGQGQSAFIGIGGDPMLGTTTADAVLALDRDPRTRTIVIVGEIGGSMEEEAAQAMSQVQKRMIAFITGRASPPGKKMGHAGAIVMKNRGSYDSKRRALEDAGVLVVDTPGEITAALETVARPS